MSTNKASVPQYSASCNESDNKQGQSARRGRSIYAYETYSQQEVLLGTACISKSKFNGLLIRARPWQLTGQQEGT